MPFKIYFIVTYHQKTDPKVRLTLRDINPISISLIETLNIFFDLKDLGLDPDTDQ